MDFPWIFHELNHPSPRLVVTGSRDVPGSHRSSHLRQARTTHLQGIQLGCILAALEGLSCTCPNGSVLMGENDGKWPK
jgi:hypothetical protein